MRCSKLIDGVVCGCDYFADAVITQIHQDGRAITFSSDQTNPLVAAWVRHLTCAKCGSRYITTPQNPKLFPAGSEDAMALLDSDRQDFSGSFDPRQEMSPT